MKINYKCQICGKECADANGLASHINRSKLHTNITVNQYIDTYLREPSDVCLECGNKIKLTLGGRSLTYCSYSCKFKHELNEKVKNGIKIAMANPKTLKKAKKTRRKIYKGKWCSKEGQSNCNAGAWSDEAIKNRIESYNNHFGADHPQQNKQYHKEYEDKLEQLYGVRNPYQSQELMRKSKKKYEYNNVTFDSSWELAYYIFLRDFNIQFEYHPKEIPFEYNNETHYTFIDFIVEGKYVEIKGDHLRNPDGTLKNLYGPDQSFMKAKQKKFDELNVQMISGKEIKPYLKYVKLNYGFDFFKNHRRK